MSNFLNLFTRLNSRYLLTYFILKNLGCYTDKLRLSRILDIPFAGRLGKYLGTWVDPGRNKSLVYHQILSAIDSRTASWKSKLLSQASRLTLLKSVLAYVNIHILSCFKLPIYVCEQIDSKCLNFFWGMDDT